MGPGSRESIARKLDTLAIPFQSHNGSEAKKKKKKRNEKKKREK